MKKYFLSLAVLMMGCAMLTACGDDDDDDNVQPTPTPEEKKAVDVSKGVFIVGSGNMQSQISGNLTFYDYAQNKTINDLFKSVNGRALGVTANDGVVYGTKLYVVVDGENTVEVMDAQTCKSIKQISTTALLGDERGKSPRRILAHGGNIYVSTYGGYVAAIDTTTYSLKMQYEAGSYPEGMAFSGKMLFVANCDYGMGQNPSISIFNSETGAKIIDLSDDLINNPTTLVARGTELYILCGDTYDPVTFAVKQKGGLRKVAMQGQGGAVTMQLMDAGLMAVKGDSLYCVADPYGKPKYFVYDMGKGEKSTFTTDDVEIPNALGVDPVTGDVVIACYTKNPDTGYGNYSAPGYAVRYDKTGKKLGTFETGVGPCAVFFNTGVRYE
jgi:hypothetical protein